MSDVLDMLNLDENGKRVVREFIDDRYGDGTCEMLYASAGQSHTHAELAMRYGIGRRAVGLRIKSALTCIRRVSRRLSVEKQGQQSTVSVCQ